jgi:hypothetical protein
MTMQFNIHFNQVLPTLAVALVFVPSCKRNSQQVITSPNQQQHWTVTTIAGDGNPRFADGPALSAEFRAPLGVTVTSGGVLYVADGLNHRIRKILTGQVTTIAGFGAEDTSSGIGTAAGYAIPIQIISDALDNLYTLDIHDFRIRKINPGGLVTVVAGSGVRGFLNGRVESARFGECSGIVADKFGNIFVADVEARRIRKISTLGIVTTFAGTGNQGLTDGPAQSAEFFALGGITLDPDGNLFASDGSRIRKITPAGQVSTIAGSSIRGLKDGPATTATFTDIAGLTIDGHGNLFVTDQDLIRMITPAGYVTTIAGSIVGYRDGPGELAQFNGAYGLATDLQGNIYLAESHNNRIRKISER